MDFGLVELIITIILGGAAITGTIAAIANRYMNKWAKKIEDLETKLMKKFDDVRKDMDKHEDRITKLHIEIEGRVSRIEEQVRWYHVLAAQAYKHSPPKSDNDE